MRVVLPDAAPQMVSPRDRVDSAKVIALVAFFAAAVRLLMIWLLPPLVDVYYYDSQAVRALLLGSNPYGHLYTGIPSWLATPGAQRVFAYFPGVVLFLAPFGAFGDVRPGLVVADLVIAWSLYSLGGRRSAAAAAFFLLAPWGFLFSTSYPDNSLVAMAFVGLAFLWESKGKTCASGFALGVSLASSQLAWLVYPFFLLSSLKERWFREVLISLATVFLLVLPFLAWDSGTFFYDTISFQFVRPAQSIVTSEPFGLNFNPTLSGVTHTLLGISAPLPLRVGVAIILLTFFLYSSRDIRGLALNASLFLLAAIFILPSDFSWWYFEFPFQTLLTWFVLSHDGASRVRAQESANA